MPRSGAVAVASAAPRQDVRFRSLSAAASGALLAAAFPPFDAGVLAWGALVPLLWAIRGESPAGAFRQGYLTGLVWFGITLFWVTLFGVPTWLLLSAVLSLYVGTFAALLRWLSRRLGGRDVVLIPLVWTAVEVARSFGPMGFPWALLGASQHEALPVLQLAALGGVHFVSLTVALGNAVLLALLTRPWRSVLLPTAAVLLLMGAGFAFGAARLRTPPAAGDRVAVIQPNIPPTAKGDPQASQFQLSVLRRLTAEAAAQGAALIVFPETAVPGNLLGPDGMAPEVGRWAPERVLVASSLEFERGAVRNTAAVLADGRLLGVYAKRRLVPFGEAGVTAGRGGDPIATPAGAIGLLICYESAFEGFARDAARGGAGVIAVLTNDGWFGRTAGPAQHAAFAPVRAVETGRTVARAANTGVSMIIDPHGRILTRLPLGTEGVAVAAASGPLETIYLRGGWLFPPAVLGVLLLLVLPGSANAMRSWARERGFTRLAGTLLWPGVIALLSPELRRIGPAAGDWVAPLALFAAAWVTAGGRRGLALRPRRAAVSALLGLAVVAALGAAMVAAYARHGFGLVMTAPSGGWAFGGGALLLAAFAQEAWLRGAVFGAAEAWRGRSAAIIISTLASLLLTRGAPPEIVIWGLLSGALFGGIRLLTGDALGLTLPRAAGMVLLAGVLALRL